MSLNTSNLSQERLRELLRYDPDTGNFIALFDHLKWKKDSIVGSIGSSGYSRIMIDKRRYQSHRLAFLWMQGEMPIKDVDHVNGIRTDNRWENLRLVTRLENNRNVKLRKDNKSGLHGVRWSSKRKRWVADIRVLGENRNLGEYVDFFLAVCSRKSAEAYFDFHPNHGRKT